MQRITIIYGSLLVGIGLAGFFGTGRASMTALIPVFFGLPVIILGIVARAENRRKHAMHAVATLTLLALFGTGRSIPKVLAFLRNEAIERPAAVIAQFAVFSLSAIFLVICINSFVQARRKRELVS